MSLPLHELQHDTATNDTMLLRAAWSLFVAQSFGKRTQGNLTTWKRQVLDELQSLFTEHADDQPLLLKLSSHLQARSSEFFST
jgi:hypothetical protein